jgi:hypothetical protein
MCMTRLNDLPLDKPVTIEPMRLSAPEGPDHRRLLEFSG